MHDWRRVPGAAYRRCAAPFGRRAVRRLERNGLPPSLAGPLRSLFGGRPDAATRDVVCRIEAMRLDLARRSASYRIAQGTTRSARWIATRSSIRPRWGLFLHRCVAAAEARTVLELGSCAGISGSYLATAPSCATMVTIEGSSDLADLAREHLGRVAPNARVVNAIFDDVLDAVLGELPPIDLAYIDGDHTREATLRYVDRVRGGLSSPGTVILDDIRWSPGMFEAWKQLQDRDDVTTAIDTGRLGVLRFGGDEPRCRGDLAAYLGWLRVEQR